MVLDGPADPGASEITAAQSQAALLEQAFGRFAVDCLRRPACRVIGAVRSSVTALVTAADRAPIATTKSGDHRRAGGGIVLSALRSALFDPTRWAALGDALVAARKGDARGLFAPLRRVHPARR